MDMQWLWLAALLVLLLALGWLWSRKRATQPAGSLGEGDQFSAAPAISEAEMALLDYLVMAFPGRPVLFRSNLSNLVAVRKAQSRLGAQQWLSGHSIDYVVCNRDGVPVYAFELDALHENDEDAERDAIEKHRVLKTAGIRLVRLKRSTRDLPTPAEFRRLLRAVSKLTPKQEAEATAGATPPRRPVATSGTAKQRLKESAAAHAGFRDTVPLTMTGLMSLPPAPDDEDEWQATRHEV